MNQILFFTMFAAVVALFMAWGFYRSMMKNSEGTLEMEEIAQYVREGAMAYLSKQYKVVAKTFGVLFLLVVPISRFGCAIFSPCGLAPPPRPTQLNASRSVASRLILGTFSYLQYHEALSPPPRHRRRRCCCTKSLR